MSVCCECCVLSGRSICDGLITRPENFYLLCCVVVCDLEASRLRRPWPALGCSATENKVVVPCGLITKVLKVFQILKIEIIFHGGRMARRDSGSRWNNTTW
jgi:hypothetical protein